VRLSSQRPAHRAGYGRARPKALSVPQASPGLHRLPGVAGIEAPRCGGRAWLLPCAGTRFEHQIDEIPCLQRHCTRVGRLNGRAARVGPESLPAQISFASRVICALKAFEMGHVCSACRAIASNVGLSRFGTLARSVNAEPVMRMPAPSGSRVMPSDVRLRLRVIEEVAREHGQTQVCERLR
jgi:hypothetical protein